MKALKLGKMTTREIAEWMGISYDYFRQRKSEKLKYLKDYGFCEFEIVHGGIQINKIMIPYFVKNISEDDKIYVQEVLNAKDHLTSVAGMARKLKRDNESYFGIPQDTIEYRLRNAGNRQFGKAYIRGDEIRDRGISGSREYVWAVKIDDYNNYRYMTDEEYEAFCEVVQEYLATKDQVEFYLDCALRDNALQDGEKILQVSSEYKNALFFSNVVMPFKAKTGLFVVRTTKHEVEESLLAGAF